MMAHDIITIGRQFGSGGSAIGHEVAARLGMECYDKRLIRLASEYGEIDIDVLAKAEERRSNPFLYSIPRQYQSDKAGRGISINDMAFNLQSAVIREIAKQRSCVIIGRCADYVLRGEKTLYSVFVFADMEHRIQRIMTRKGIGRRQAEVLIRETDKARRNYYANYTGRKWGEPEHYDLAVNSGSLGIEQSVEMICGMVRARGETGQGRVEAGNGENEK